MTESSSPRATVRPLLRVRQIREFTSEPVDRTALDAIADAARWSGSGRNEQPWRFVVVTDGATIRRLHTLGLPQTRSLATAPAVVAIVLPDDGQYAVMRAFDEGRAAERMLVAASLLGLAAGIAWIRDDVRAAAEEILGVPTGRLLRTLVAIGHPTEAARQPKSPPGQGRLPREQVVFEERWREE